MKNYILTLIIGLFLVPSQGQAQLLEVKQTVFGMDCAPCAYALENRINNMAGITSAAVSLNDGLLTAVFKTENTLTLQQIRKAVKESGFSPKKAEINVTGTLQKETDQYVLVTPSGDNYALKPGNSELESRLKDVQPGKKITLHGLIKQRKATETEYWVLLVKS